MKTTILTQKKYSINLKESSANIDKFISEIFLLAKTLKEEKDKGMKMSQAHINPVDQTIDVTVTADIDKVNTEQDTPSNEPQHDTRSDRYQSPQPRTMPPRPRR